VLHGVVNHRRIDGKDGVAGSIPAGGSTKPMTSANAGQFGVRGSVEQLESTSHVGMRSNWSIVSPVLVARLTSVITRPMIVFHLGQVAAQRSKNTYLDGEQGVACPAALGRPA
jgi:hypothetical protein